jgi:hypothetical protein
MLDCKGLLKAAYAIFNLNDCCSRDVDVTDSPNGNIDVDAVHELADIDKMRCHVIKCLTALHLMQTYKKKTEEGLEKHSYELAKSKVFSAAISMISDYEFDSDEILVSPVLSAFLDEKNVCNGQNWLPQHFAITVSLRNEITENDIRIMLSINPLAMHRLSTIEADNEGEENLPKFSDTAGSTLFELSDQYGRCALHLVAQYSESVELLQDILQMDHEIISLVIFSTITGNNSTALGMLCSRIHFPSLHKMVSCLIEVDSKCRIYL